MPRLVKPILCIMLAGVLIAGCSSEQSPFTSQIPSQALSAGLAQLGIPEGATLESATFNIYVASANDRQIDVHAVTADWGETTVTWNNFGGSFDPAIEGSFMADGVGYRSVDITSLVSAWLAGETENFGVLLDQVEVTYPRALYSSREAVSNNPYLEVCYEYEGVLTCEMVDAAADAYIWQIDPNGNHGTGVTLYTGWLNENDLEKQTLVRFDLETIPGGGDGCTRTIGYWKTHDGFGPQDDMVSGLLPIWLGDEGGENSMQVTTAQMASDILDQNVYGKPSNGITKLYAQLLGAKLNMASDADGSDVSAAMSAADAFLADYDWNDWKSLSQADQNMVLGWKSTMDDYNNGLIGPGHCGDMSDDMIDE
ncbi:DNRLRE domain-containing protein [bacterium]|nr:DNRLRE domain-containing protein [bacterium]MCB2202363.1 DNRLRE domain-containing protein [bacterium]